MQTTAHSLCFAFALLALYTEEQDKLYNHIKSIIPDGRIPVRCSPSHLPTNFFNVLFGRPMRKCPCSHIPWRKLPSACMMTWLWEENKPQGDVWSTSHVPSGSQVYWTSTCCTTENPLYKVAHIPKIADKDTTLTVTNAQGKTKVIPVPKGTDVAIVTPALHYNRELWLNLCWSNCQIKTSARYWEDPHAFKPQRFLQDWPREAFLPFSAAARACLGRKWEMLICHIQIIFKCLLSHLFHHQVWRDGGCSFTYFVRVEIQDYGQGRTAVCAWDVQAAKGQNSEVCAGYNGHVRYIQSCSNLYLVPDGGFFLL